MMPGVPGMAEPGRVTRVAFVDLGIGPERKRPAEGGLLGVTITAEDLSEALPLLEEARPEVVVVRIDANGGDPAEVLRIRDVLQKQYARQFRVVAWVREALSVAAMSAWLFDEMYMAPDGRLGLMSKTTRAIDHVTMNAWETASREAGRDPRVFDAMLRGQGLSMTVSELGEVRLFGDAVSGTHVLNADNNLGFSFNAADAMLLRASRGTAATEAELMKAMGIERYEIVGQRATQFIEHANEQGEAALRQAREASLKLHVSLKAARALEGEAQIDARLREVSRGIDAYLTLRQLITARPALLMFLDSALFGPVTEAWLDGVSREFSVLASPLGR
jgi:hypothetical protein